MKNLDEVLVNYKKDNVDKNLKYTYASALKDSDFKNLVNSIKLKEEVAYKNTSKLQDTIIELRNCKDCKGIPFCQNKVTGYTKYPVIENESVIITYKACKYTKKLEKETKKIEYYELPYDLQIASMSKIDVTDKKRAKVIKWLKEFYDNYEKGKDLKGLYLHGSFGCGKTYLVMALLNELAKKDINVIAVYYPFLLRNLKESFSSDFSNRIDSLMKCDILLLDDIGAENVTSWSRDEILGTILQYRMDNHLVTFFTSNYNILELENHFRGKDSLVEARRIMERIKQLTISEEMISANRRK